MPTKRKSCGKGKRRSPTTHRCKKTPKPICAATARSSKRRTSKKSRKLSRKRKSTQKPRHYYWQNPSGNSYCSANQREACWQDPRCVWRRHAGCAQRPQQGNTGYTPTPWDSAPDQRFEADLAADRQALYDDQQRIDRQQAGLQGAQNWQEAGFHPGALGGGQGIAPQQYDAANFSPAAINL